MRIDELFSRSATEKTWTRVQGRRVVAQGVSGLTDSTLKIVNVLRHSDEEA